MMLLLKFSLLSYLSNFLQKKGHASACSFFILKICTAASAQAYSNFGAMPVQWKFQFAIFNRAGIIPLAITVEIALPYPIFI